MWTCLFYCSILETVAVAAYFAAVNDTVGLVALGAGRLIEVTLTLLTLLHHRRLFAHNTPFDLQFSRWKFWQHTRLMTVPFATLICVWALGANVSLAVMSGFTFYIMIRGLVIQGSYARGPLWAETREAINLYHAWFYWRMEYTSPPFPVWVRQQEKWCWCGEGPRLVDIPNQVRVGYQVPDPVWGLFRQLVPAPLDDPSPSSQVSAATQQSDDSGDAALLSVSVSRSDS